MEKERRTKALLLSTLVVVVATLSIAFAAMSRTLSINGIGKMDTASWSVYFDKLEGPTLVRGAKQVSAPSISADKGTVQDINVKLSNPKDEISYTVDIVNDGTIDAEITMIKDIELTDVQKKVFEFKVTYTDTGEILQNGDLLPAGNTKNITITIRFKDDITEADLPTEQQIINLSYQITYTQYDGGNIPIIPDGGLDVPNGGGENVPRYVLFNEWYDEIDIDYETEIESISFLRNTDVPEAAEDTVVDVSEEGDETVICWYEDTDSNDLYEVYFCANGIIAAPEDCYEMFAFMEELKEINFSNNFDTSNAIFMNFMFEGCISLMSLDLSSFDTSKATEMSAIFSGCESLVSLNISSFDTSNVTDMSFMFEDCYELTSLNLKHFDTSNVTDIQGMKCMFYNCSSLTSLDLSSFNTSNVTNMAAMFYNCSSLTSLDLSHFNTSNVTTLTLRYSGDYVKGMFEGCSKLANLDLSSFDISKVTDMASMFARCTSLTSIDFRKADFSNITNNTNMFEKINSSVQIIIKDETQRTWLADRFPELTNVVLPSEL